MLTRRLLRRSSAEAQRRGGAGAWAGLARMEEAEDGGSGLESTGDLLEPLRAEAVSLTSGDQEPVKMLDALPEDWHELYRTADYVMNAPPRLHPTETPR